MLTVAHARGGGALADALARRRPASAGGAYTLLLDPGAPTREGRLAGVPVAVKDLIDVAGAPTRCGSAARREAPPAEHDAPVVGKLRRAGAAIVGKTALHEFAFGATGLNPFEGTPRNPRDPKRIAGGSSSGSAVAVAEGSAAIALGTDTGGSVRIPAALCGVVGFKPSYGLISAEGVFPLSLRLDHVGVLAADVASVRAVMAVLAPEERWDAPPPVALRLDRAALEDASPGVARAVEAAVRALRIPVAEATLPDGEEVVAVSTTLMFSEAAKVHRETLRERWRDYAEDVRERLVLGDALSAAEFATAARRATRLRAAVREILRPGTVIVGPTVPITAPTIDETERDPEMSGTLVRYTRLANVVGFPAISIPVPSSGLPVGLQILGSTDASVLSAAELVESSLRAL